MVSAAARGRAVGSQDAPRAVNIGAVLELLRRDFPDISISKIRYLEDQGLVEPLRTAAGYRKFTPAHVERLRYVLEVQRDHYLPLRVIREHLDALDRGLEPPVVPAASGTTPRLVEIVPDRPDQPDQPDHVGRPDLPDLSEAAVPVASAGQASRVTPSGQNIQDPRPAPGRRFSRAQLLAVTGIDEALLADLQAHSLVSARPSGHFDAEAVAVARVVGALAGFGIEPRHLRAFRAAADREAGLIEQVTSPLRRRGESAGTRAEDVARELSALCAELHSALLQTALERGWH